MRDKHATSDQCFEDFAGTDEKGKYVSHFNKMRRTTMSRASRRGKSVTEYTEADRNSLKRELAQAMIDLKEYNVFIEEEKISYLKISQGAWRKRIKEIGPKREILKQRISALQAQLCQVKLVLGSGKPKGQPTFKDDVRIIVQEELAPILKRQNDLLQEVLNLLKDR